MPSPRNLAAPVQAAATAPGGAESRVATGPLRWVATGWDDPRAVALREAMDADLTPRYAHLREQRRRLALAAAPGGLRTAPTAREVLVAWVALDGDRPVATASLRRLGPADPLHAGDVTPAADDETATADGALHEVKRVFVVPSHRRRGLAAAALRAVEGSARERGIARLVLQTGTRQPEAVALYEREGWRHIAAYPPYPLESSICFEKLL